MKKIILLLLSVIFLLPAFAQNTGSKDEDAANLVLKPWVPEQIEGMPAPARKNLENKLSQILTKNGLGGNSIDGRFIITANVNILTKDITPTAPPMQAYTLDVTFYIGDGIDGTLFSSTSLTLKGVGDNAQKAYLAALRSIKTSDPSYQTFIEKGKEKIIDYYNRKCDFIIKEAETLAGLEKYEEAIAKLVAVPNVCRECYDKCMNAVEPIYQKYIDQQCALKLQEARAIWQAGQDLAAAKEASSLLTSISPKASCFPEVDKLNNQIGARVKALDQREWDNMQQQQKRAYELEKQSIKAIRDVGVAYGNHQQPTTYNVVWW